MEATEIRKGQPPAAFAERLHYHTGGEPLTVLQSEPAAPVAPPAPEAPRWPWGREGVFETVRLEAPAREAFPGFALKFQTSAVDLGELYISLIVPPSVEFLPSGPMSFVLEHRGQRYPVDWVGGMFRFPGAGFHCLSFLRTGTA
jgi:hypothetical protein